MIVRLAIRELETKFGTFTEILYGDQSIALVKGEVEDGEGTLCRIHSSCISAHVFNSIECECREEMEASQRIIQETGKGVIVWLDQEGKGNGHLALMKSIEFKKQGFSQSEAYVKAGYKADARSYHPAAEILTELKVRSIILLTDNAGKAADLRDASVIVAKTRPLK